MEKYSDCMLIYKISENKPYGEINKKNYDKMKKALNAAGFFLDVENGVLKLQISQYGYERKQKRNAGRKKKCALPCARNATLIVSSAIRKVSTERVTTAANQWKRSSR